MVTIYDVMTREPKPLANKELQKIEKRIKGAVDRCGAKADELTKEIDKSRQAEQVKAREVAREKEVPKYIRKKGQLERQKQRTASLISERDELIDKELSADEYKGLIVKAVSVYEADQEKRKAEIINHLSMAYELLEMEYDQATAITKALSPLNDTLNSTGHDEIKKSIKATCDSMFKKQELVFQSSPVSQTASVKALDYANRLKVMLKEMTA